MDPERSKRNQLETHMFYFYIVVLTLMYWGKTISMVVGMINAAAKIQNPPQAVKTVYELLSPKPTPNLDWKRLENEDPKSHSRLLKWYASGFIFCLCAPFLAYWLVGMLGGYSLLAGLAMFI